MGLRMFMLSHERERVVGFFFNYLLTRDKSVLKKIIQVIVYQMPKIQKIFDASLDVLCVKMLSLLLNGVLISNRPWIIISNVLVFNQIHTGCLNDTVSSFWLFMCAMYITSVSRWTSKGSVKTAHWIATTSLETQSCSNYSNSWSLWQTFPKFQPRLHTQAVLFQHLPITF